MFVRASVGDSTGTTDVVGPSNVLYVDGVMGNDATGTRGNFARPFLTVQAAINAMQPYDTVQLAPQWFDISTPLTIPATVGHGFIRGWGSSLGNSLVGWWGADQTVLHGVGGTVVFDFGANLGLLGFGVSDLDIWNDADTTIITAEGTLYPQDTYLQEGGLEFTRCTLYGGVTATYATMQFVDCTGRGPLSFTSCQFADFVRAYFNSSPLTWTFDATDLQAPSAQGSLRIRLASSIGGAGGGFVEVGGQPWLLVDETTVIGGLRGNNLSVAGGFAPQITVGGSVGETNGGVLDFYSAPARQLPDTATPCNFDFRGARFYQSTSVGSSILNGPSTIGFKIAGAAANPQIVRLDGAQALPAVNLICGANVRLSARGAGLPGAVITTPDATGYVYPPSPLLLAPVAVGAAPQPVVYPFRFDPAAVNVQVSYQTDNAASVPTGVITLRAQTGFSAGLVAAGGGNLVASVQVP